MPGLHLPSTARKHFAFRARICRGAISPSHAMVPLVRAAALTNYLEVANSLGFNACEALRRAGLNQAMLQDPEQRIPTDAAVALLEESASASDCINFGLRMAESRQLSHFGAIS